jgi:large subunit ribosomal protein L4
MPTVKARNLKNKEVGEVTLSDAVFGVELNEALIHSAVMNYQANGRSGNSATKTRGNVSGSGRKLWKQKGTGRARIASLRSPLWKGGGNVHGPQPRDWSYQMPKKMRRGALRSALSERLREGNLIVIDEFGIKNPKTKELLSTLGTLGLTQKGATTKTLIIDSLDNANLVLSARNVQKTKITNSFGLNIYDIVYHEKLVLSKAAVEELNNLLDPNREAGIIEPVAVEESKQADEPKAKRAAKPKAEKADNETEAAPVKAKGKTKKAAPVEEEAATESSPVEESAVEAAPAEESTVTEDTPAEETAPATSEEAANDE